MIKFSIITVVYNGGNVIQKTIESIVNQTYQNFEYIIIDGLSQDNTMDIIRNYNSKVTIAISEKDNGIYDAMNKGLILASSDYVIFMNAGDTFNDLADLKQSNAEITNNNMPDFIYYDANEKEKFNEKLLLKKARSYQWKWFGMFAHHQAIFYKLSTLKKHKIIYNLRYKLSSDWDFTLRFLEISNSMIHFKRPICIFERGGASINYKLGLKEQFQIRRTTLSYSFFVSSIIYMMQYLLVKLRHIFPRLYDLIRFNRKSHA